MHRNPAHLPALLPEVSSYGGHFAVRGGIQRQDKLKGVLIRVLASAAPENGASDRFFDAVQSLLVYAKVRTQPHRLMLN